MLLGPAAKPAAVWPHVDREWWRSLFQRSSLQLIFENGPGFSLNDHSLLAIQRRLRSFPENVKATDDHSRSSIQSSEQFFCVL